MASIIKEYASVIAICLGIILTSLGSYVAVGTIALPAIFRGVLLGFFYAMLATGLSLVFGVMKVINIAHGEYVLLGAYITFWLFTYFGLNPFISLTFSAAFLLALGLLIGKYLISPALKGGVDPPLIISFGLSLSIANLMRVIWSATPRGIHLGLGTISLLGIHISIIYLIVSVAALAGLILLHYFISKTFLGKAISAVSVDREASELMGISSTRIETLSYAIGLLLAGVSGSLLSLTLSFDPTIGPLLLGKTMCIIVLGGVGYISGALAGGVVLGVAEAVGSLFLGDTARDLVAFVIFLLILIFKPTGLFAKYRAF